MFLQQNDSLCQRFDDMSVWQNVFQQNVGYCLGCPIFMWVLEHKWEHQIRNQGDHAKINTKAASSWEWSAVTRWKSLSLKFFLHVAGVKLHYTSGHWHLVILQWTSFFDNFAGYTLKKELLLLFIKRLSFFCLSFLLHFCQGFIAGVQVCRQESCHTA